MILLLWIDMARKKRSPSKKQAEKGKYGETKKRINIVLTPTAINILEARSNKTGVSRSEIIERLVRQQESIDSQYNISDQINELGLVVESLGSDQKRISAREYTFNDENQIKQESKWIIYSTMQQEMKLFDDKQQWLNELWLDIKKLILNKGKE